VENLKEFAKCFAYFQLRNADPEDGRPPSTTQGRA